MVKIKVALTHDIDRIQKTYQYFTKSARAIAKLSPKALINQLRSITDADTIFWNFDKIMTVESKYGVRSSNYFLFESIKFNLFKPGSWKLSLGRYDSNDPNIKLIIRELDQNGWEIGLHGSYLSYMNLSLMKSEKLILEDILGKKVYGIRQHYLNLSETTWSIQKEAGFLYDTSLGFTREIGFKDARVAPFRPFDDHFLEIPLVIMDSCFASDKQRWKKLDMITQQAVTNNGIIVLNWHNNNLDPRDFPHYFEYYEELIKYFKDKGAKFYRLIDYYQEIMKVKI